MKNKIYAALKKLRFSKKAKNQTILDPELLSKLKILRNREKTEAPYYPKRFVSLVRYWRSKTKRIEIYPLLLMRKPITLNSIHRKTLICSLFTSCYIIIKHSAIKKLLMGFSGITLSFKTLNPLIYIKSLTLPSLSLNFSLPLHQLLLSILSLPYIHYGILAVLLILNFKFGYCSYYNIRYSLVSSLYLKRTKIKLSNSKGRPRFQNKLIPMALCNQHVLRLTNIRDIALKSNKILWFRSGQSHKWKYLDLKNSHLLDTELFLAVFRHKQVRFLSERIHLEQKRFSICFVMFCIGNGRELMREKGKYTELSFRR
jgi:hypothetical protein